MSNPVLLVRIQWLHGRVTYGLVSEGIPRMSEKRHSPAVFRCLPSTVFGCAKSEGFPCGCTTLYLVKSTATEQQLLGPETWELQGESNKHHQDSMQIKGGLFLLLASLGTTLKRGHPALYNKKHLGGGPNSRASQTCRSERRSRWIPGKRPCSRTPSLSLPGVPNGKSPEG